MIPIPFPHLDLPFQPDWVQGAREIVSRLNGFDLAVLPRPDDPWSGTLVRATNIPRRLGYDLPRTRPFLTDTVLTPRRHHASVLALDVARAALRILGAEAPDTGPEVQFRADEGAIEGLDVPRPVILHPGTGWPLKNWSTDRWGTLAAMLAEELGTVPLVLGGPGEQDMIDTVVAASGGRAQRLNAPLSVGGLAALHHRARLVVGADSGPLHLAAIMGAPIVVLFGPADPLEFAPLCAAERSRLVRVQLPCSPCGTLLDPPCGAHHDPLCMTGIAVSQVLAAALDLDGRMHRMVVDVTSTGAHGRAEV